MKKRFIVFLENGLKINNGFFISEIVYYIEIDSILPFTEKFLENNNVLKIGLIGKLEPYNVIVKLKNEKIFTIIYALEKKSNFVTFYVEDKLGFEQQLTSKLAAIKND